MDRVYFHGDVVLRETVKPQNVKPVAEDSRGVVLAEGELTGHYHAIKDVGKAELLVDKDGKLYLEIKEECEIYHQEHNAQFYSVETGKKEKILPGFYEVDTPQEYDHFEQLTRKVMD